MRLFLAIVGVLMALAPASAHHSFAAEFDINQPIEVRGILQKMTWTNPHGWIFIDVKGPDGTTVQWGIETSSPQQLLRKGLRKTDFPIGSEVVAKGYRARDGSNNANGESVTFADGRNFYLGAPKPDADK